MPTESSPDPDDLLPPPSVLRDRLARAMREVAILSGLLRLAERVGRQTGRPVEPRPEPSSRKGVSRG